jgi:ABC-type Fe3+/spermidine/putrescine transport system ATPase subunit
MGVPEGGSAGGLSLVGIGKSFGGAGVLHDVELDVSPGEFFSILGPSGCGKTTLLRVVAGFEQPDRGSVILAGRDVTRVSARERGVGMVFQNYALFPSMTVRGNLAFGLERRGASRAEVDVRVRSIAEAVGMVEKLEQNVTSLSGGEQQRVAVARALVVEPAVLLFDEPLSNLDVTLRQRTREEIRTLQRRFGITALYVTHDRGEALSLSDRIGVMRDGRLEQVGPPADVYESPASPFVAEFLGDASLVRGTVLRNRFRPDGAADDHLLAVALRDGPAVAAVRPENVEVRPAGGPGMPATVVSVEYLGLITTVTVRWNGVLLRSVRTGSFAGGPSLRAGEAAGVAVDWQRVAVFPGE